MKIHFLVKLSSAFIFLIIVGCSPSAYISKQAKNNLFHSGELEQAHVGISIYDASANRSIYTYQDNKYFVPASNTKLFSCYAAMKYLGDSLSSIMYAENDTAVYIVPLGDPTLLHKDFGYQPVINFLQGVNKKIYINASNWKDNGLGAGWSWDDYNSDYMAERSPLPVYGNVIRWVQELDSSQMDNSSVFNSLVTVYSLPEVNWKIRFNPDSSTRNFSVTRRKDENVFIITEGKESKKEIEIPFITNGLESAIQLLPDTIGKVVNVVDKPLKNLSSTKTIRSQPLDSLLRPMMYRSDNFFSEQALLMVSQKMLAYMNAARIIDTLLKIDLKDLPQRPRWVDGSGLSRYNLFTPADFVWLLKKMKDEFGIDRLKRILPTGGTGTLSNFFKDENGVIFAKTGTLSGVVALSGFLVSKKNKLLIFSILINNHNGSSVNIRKQTEAFLRSVREHY